MNDGRMRSLSMHRRLADLGCARTERQPQLACIHSAILRASQTASLVCYFGDAVVTLRQYGQDDAVRSSRIPHPRSAPHNRGSVYFVLRASS